MTLTKITSDGKYLAQCHKCGTWVEVGPEICASQAQMFFEVLLADFCCCGLRQSATFVQEKDTVDFH